MAQMRPAVFVEPSGNRVFEWDLRAFNPISNASFRDFMLRETLMKTSF